MRTTLALAAVFIAVIVGGVLLSNRHSPTSVTDSQAPAVASSTVSTDVSYTAAQIAAHDTSKDCWASIDGNVYNLTDWIAQHPGGESAIVTICGKDGSSAFNGQHGRDPRAQSMLAGFRIGTLAQ